jgi:Flp pilus assembly protein TadB
MDSHTKAMIEISQKLGHVIGTVESIKETQDNYVARIDAKIREYDKKHAENDNMRAKLYGVAIGAGAIFSGVIWLLKSIGGAIAAVVTH